MNQVISNSNNNFNNVFCSYSFARFQPNFNQSSQLSQTSHSSSLLFTDYGFQPKNKNLEKSINDWQKFRSKLDERIGEIEDRPDILMGKFFDIKSFREMICCINTCVKLFFKDIPWNEGGSGSTCNGSGFTNGLFNDILKDIFNGKRPNSTKVDQTKTQIFGPSTNPKQQAFEILLKKLKNIRQELLTLKFFWSYNCKEGIFHLNENFYCTVSSIESKVIFHFANNVNVNHDVNMQDSSEDSTSQGKKFVQEIIKISTHLSKLPKSILILLTIFYICNEFLSLFHQIKKIVPASFFTPEEIFKFEAIARNYSITLEALNRIWNHFSFSFCLKNLREVVKKSVGLNLFLLSDRNEELLGTV